MHHIQARGVAGIAKGNKGRHFLASPGTVGAWFVCFQQVTFKPCSLVFRGTHDGLDTLHGTDHALKVPTVAETPPIGGDPAPEVDGAAHVERAATGAHEPVDPGTMRQLSHHGWCFNWAGPTGVGHCHHLAC